MFSTWNVPNMGEVWDQCATKKPPGASPLGWTSNIRCQLWPGLSSSLFLSIKEKQYTWVSLWRWTRRQCWGWWQGGQGFRGTRSGLGGSTIYLIFLSMLSMFGVNVLWVYSSVFAWGIFEYLGSRPSTQSCFSAAKDTEIILINENGVIE